MVRRLFKEDHLRAQLRMLRRHSPSVRGSVIASAEGLPVVADLPDAPLNEEQIAARAAAMEAMGQRVAWDLARGMLDQILLGSDDGFVLITQIDERASLVLLCSHEARLAVLQLEIETTLGVLRRLL